MCDGRGVQELLTLNSGWSPAAAHAAALHSIHLLGSRAYELYPDVDCPADAYYFDAVHYVDGAALSYRRSACVFEQARATPLRRRRRRERGDGRVDGLTDNVLVVRTIIVVDDNDYIIDVVLHQNAVIEAVCSVSGALSTHYYFSPDTQLSGYQVGYWTTRGLDISLTRQLADATGEFACLVFVLLVASARPRVVQSAS